MLREQQWPLISHLLQDIKKFWRPRDLTEKVIQLCERKLEFTHCDLLKTFSVDHKSMIKINRETVLIYK